MTNIQKISKYSLLSSEELENLPEETKQLEWKKCSKNVVYFVMNYVKIYDSIESGWIPFHLWPDQIQVLRDLEANKLVVVLKARQLGLTWLCLAFALWLALFHPIAIILLFSRRDDEAKYLLSNERLKGMYKRLPTWLQSNIIGDSTKQLKLQNGSVFYCFPTTAGDSYTATLVIVDEADLVPDLGKLLSAVKPTIDAGNRMIMISRSDKSNPKSIFKNTYRTAKLGKNKWKAVFLPWFSRLDRTQEWYEEQKRDIISRTGYIDTLYEQYPNTDKEALSSSTANKRIPPLWLEKCYEPMDPLLEQDWPEEVPAIPDLRIYKLPEPGLTYSVGLDPAEGNPNSNDSSINVICKETGEQVAVIAGKHEPETISGYADDIAIFYNHAPILIGRNNHGHTCISWFENFGQSDLLNGPDEKPGWLETRPGRTSLYDDCATGAKNGDYIIHDKDTYDQLASIEGNTLKAPNHDEDDNADSFALSFKGIMIDSQESSLLQGDVRWKYRDINNRPRKKDAALPLSAPAFSQRRRKKPASYRQWP